MFVLKVCLYEQQFIFFFTTNSSKVQDIIRTKLLVVPVCDQRWHKVLGHSVPQLGLVMMGQCQTGYEE